MSQSMQRQRSPRRCSQCRKIGCSKNKANCVWNRNIDIDRMTRGLEPLFGINTRYTTFRDYDDIVPQSGLKLGSEYVKEISLVLDLSGPMEEEHEEECGICYSNQCTIASNCGHKYCRVCVQNLCIEIKDKTKGLDCAFCRSCITTFTTTDESTHGIFTSFIQNVF